MERGPAMAPAVGPEAVVGSAAALAAQEEMRWRQLDSGVSAVSFGFVATAILVSMFLAMAILEHFLRAPAHRGPVGIGALPHPPPPPPGGVLSRLRLLLHRRGIGAGEAAFPGGSDLEAARKLDGHASPEVWPPATLLPHALPLPVHRFNDSVVSPLSQLSLFASHRIVLPFFALYLLI
ncbi:hypothetical protein E2562_008996 [Oryza meyeriana var. granulata]|uniref:Uncharacterized protein n=1 Tax=Oryza meyeriana var. granulata TaxID=110450 RepID=A0A6G1D1E5_9ORYZ|nr:hypothetical protein E2562_008996 [Oryza meyeriana var. granulata]